MITGTEQQISVFSSEEDHLSCYRLSIVAYIFLWVGVRSHRLFSIQFGMPLGIILVWFMFGQICWLCFMAIASDFTRRHIPQKTCNHLDLTTYLHPLPQCALSHTVMTVL